MIHGNSVLAIIPARGGSKGLPGKNIMPLAGKPLIAWTIEAAHRCTSIDRVILSSDDPEIIRVARAYGCEVPFVRPPELATDEASTIDVVLHALRECHGFGVVTVLQPTSPLRTSDDIELTLSRLAATHSCVSVCETDKPPRWMFTLDATNVMHPLLGNWDTGQRRQQVPVAYALNGAVYAASVPWLLKHRRFIGPGTSAHVMPRERSVDIDTEFDARWAAFLLNH